MGVRELEHVRRASCLRECGVQPLALLAYKSILCSLVISINIASVKSHSRSWQEGRGVHREFLALTHTPQGVELLGLHTQTLSGLIINTTALAPDTSSFVHGQKDSWNATSPHHHHSRNDILSEKKKQHWLLSPLLSVSQCTILVRTTNDNVIIRNMRVQCKGGKKSLFSPTRSFGSSVFPLFFFLSSSLFTQYQDNKKGNQLFIRYRKYIIVSFLQ